MYTCIAAAAAANITATELKLLLVNMNDADEQRSVLLRALLVAC
jgi:hypothetical protein